MFNFEDTITSILYDPLTGKIIFLLIATAILIIIIKMIQNGIANNIKDTNIRYKIRKLLDFAGFLCFIFIITLAFNDKLGSLTVAFGVAGAGIAFALQEVIASIAGWFAITFNSFFKPGDRVLLGGICGDVIDVGVLRTTLMECGGWVKGDLYNGRVVRVSNSYIFKEPVFNYNTGFPFLWDEITIPVKYGSDLKMARTLINDVAVNLLGEYTRNAEDEWENLVKRYMIEDATLTPMVTLTADENWVTFTLRYITDYKLRRGTKDRLFSNILEKIDLTEGKVSIASVSIVIASENHQA